MFLKGVRQARLLSNRIKAQFFTRCLCVPVTEQKVLTNMPPPSINEDKVYDEKLHNIVKSISSLTLIEVSELNQLLKKTLNIPDAPMMAFGSMPSAKEEEEETESTQMVQTSFAVKLTGFEDTKKVALIKEIKSIMEGMNLVQAKKFVEGTPVIVKADLPKDEAEKLKESLIAAGGQCEIE